MNSCSSVPATVILIIFPLVLPTFDPAVAVDVLVRIVEDGNGALVLVARLRPVVRRVLRLADPVVFHLDPVGGAIVTLDLVEVDDPGAIMSDDDQLGAAAVVTVDAEVSVGVLSRLGGRRQGEEPKDDEQ